MLKKGLTCTPKYYFETNSLYHIGKVKEDFIPESFTSALAICELISGLTQDNFAKRKALLYLIEKRELFIDWHWPEEIISKSYQVFDAFEFIDTRGACLQRIMACLLNSRDFGSFSEATNKIKESDGISYFVGLEDQWSSRFVSAALLGHQALKQSFQQNPDESISVNGKIYQLRNHKELEEFLMAEFGANRSITIDALSGLLLTAQEFKAEGISKQEIYESYNGWMDHFVDAYTKALTLLATKRSTPHKNDFVDLLHILYLRDFGDCKIVSEDKIFKVCEDLRIQPSQLV